MHVDVRTERRIRLLCETEQSRGRSLSLLTTTQRFINRAYLQIHASLTLKFLVNIHRRTIGAVLGFRLPSYRSFLINHLSRNRNNVVLDQLLAHVLNVCKLLSVGVNTIDK